MVFFQIRHTTCCVLGSVWVGFATAGQEMAVYSQQILYIMAVMRQSDILLLVGGIPAGGADAVPSTPPTLSRKGFLKFSRLKGAFLNLFGKFSENKR